MRPPIVYDLSRLLTRVLNPTPNGIDRVDLLLAQHFLMQGDFDWRAIRLGFHGPRVLSPPSAREAIGRTVAAWCEDAPARSPAYDAVVARLVGTPASVNGYARRIIAARPQRPLHVAKALIGHLPANADTPEHAAPDGALYINASHFPLEWKRHVAWLDARPDVRPLFWIHDLLRVDHPEWFWSAEPAFHAQRLNLLARRGAGAVVGSVAIANRLEEEMIRRGRRDLPILKLNPPVAPIFSTPRHDDPRLAQTPFFLICGTIEPRKNHLLLLRVWRRLIARFGHTAPKLVVIGKRGWRNEDIINGIEQLAESGQVIEVAGLQTADYKRLLDHCCALLAPSLAEGFGLPIAEALRAGAPVLAADIAPFREQTGPDIGYLDPASEVQWLEAIMAKASMMRPRLDAPARAEWARPGAGALSEIDAFICTLTTSH